MQTPVQKYGNNAGRIFAFKLGGKQEVAAMPSDRSDRPAEAAG